MLFVFQVDTGRMMTFDMGLALESVQNLKSHVELTFKIPVDKQVLLISGGEFLSPDDRVCSYPAGTDTNPIFLFSKTVIESDITPPDLGASDPASEVIDHPKAAAILAVYFKYVRQYMAGSLTDLTSKVREAADLPPTYQAVQRRVQLSKIFCEASQNQMKVFENLVHEQHLQHQGWSAVVANLEDLYADLQVRWDFYREAFNEYIAKRDSYLDFLSHFKDDLLTLQKIPVLPALIESQNLIVPEDDDNFAVNKQGDGVKEGMTLLEWISQRDDFMDSLFEICSKGLIQTDEREFRSLQHEVERNMENNNNVEMKEIKGLSGRLQSLEMYMAEARGYVSEQLKLAESFQRNHNRASQLRDASVLPDICATHQQQLNVMLDNYNRIRVIAQKAVRCKYELSANLAHRLRWVVFSEGNLSELDNKLVFCFQNLLSLQRQLEILQQVHTAPTTYLSTIIEIVRRRKISQAFLVWASDVACNLLTIYNEETARRKDFQSQIEGHFLSSLFPGMDDLPPTFATQAPSIFDSSLPKLTEDDVDRLRRELPEMADALQIPDTSQVTHYFTVRDEADKHPNKTVEDKLIEVVTEAGLASNLDQNILKAIEGEPPQTTPHGLPHLKDLDRGCESETDTEEFEKVGQSPFDLHFDKGIPSARPGTQDASTLTSEDNLQISRSEYERLRSALVRLSQIGCKELTLLKLELAEAKKLVLEERACAVEQCNHLRTIFGDFVHESEYREREVVQRLTVDHELEIIDFRKISQSKNEEIKSLRDTNAGSRNLISELSIENSELKQKLQAGRDEQEKELTAMQRRFEELLEYKEKSVKEITERLKGEHKSELESIRARFKLMTMERSPSENSLEKIDYASLTNHEAVLIQMTENFESEKEVAVSDAVAKERARWEQVLDQTRRQMDLRFSQEKAENAFLLQDVQTRMQQDQEKQIAQLQDELARTSSDCTEYKNTIQQLTEDSHLVKKIEALEAENAQFRQELEKIKMAASVAVCEGAGTSDAATSPVRVRKPSELSCAAARVGKLNVDSCKPGDLVLVVWDLAHQNFKVLQERNSLYFLNADCLEALGLRILDGQPNKLYCYAEVVEKEYCHARKPVNRFRVPQGTKFFRVKVRPVAAREAVQTSSTSMSQSQAASTSQLSESSVGLAHASSLPSSPSRSQSQEAAIPEERGEDAATAATSEKDEEVERGTELTEGFNVDNNQSSIDR